MGFKSTSDDSGPLSEINITPLVDVMLVLLIIFMVATPMMETGIPIQLPKASSKALPKTESPLTLTLTKEARIFINKQEVSYSQLKDKLSNLVKSKNQREIFIRADGALPYALVAQAMATVKEAGLDKIGLVTLPGETETASGSGKKPAN
jgi:biopolymer transport protein TolR